MILNSKLGLFVLFILTTSFVSADDDDETTTTEPVLGPRPIPKEESDEFLVEVNKRRRSFAKEHNIANMHELKWSQHLADLVDADAKKGTVAGDSTAEKSYERDTKFSCALVGIDRYSWEAVQEIVSVKGEPGSKCYEGYGNNDGLCSLPSTATTEDPTTTTTTTTPEPTTTTTTEATTTEESTPIPEEPSTKERPRVTQKVKDAPAPDAPKPQPTQRPASVPEKQTSDGESKDSEESEDVEESEESGLSTLASLYSVLVYILLFQLWTLF